RAQPLEALEVVLEAGLHNAQDLARAPHLEILSRLPDRPCEEQGEPGERVRRERHRAGLFSRAAVAQEPAARGREQPPLRERAAALGASVEPRAVAEQARDLQLECD